MKLLKSELLPVNIDILEVNHHLFTVSADVIHIFQTASELIIEYNIEQSIPTFPKVRNLILPQMAVSIRFSMMGDSSEFSI
jgi:hypothetical protein